MEHRPGPTRLRRTSIVAAPLLIVAVAGFGVAVAAASWAAWEPSNRTGPWWAWVVVPVVVGAGVLVLARGCLVTVDDRPGGEVRDVVCWRTRRRIPAGSVEQALVQRGPWRLYVLRLDTGEEVALLGASPNQWPARLLPWAQHQDVEDLELLVHGRGARTDGTRTDGTEHDAGDAPHPTA